MSTSSTTPEIPNDPTEETPAQVGRADRDYWVDRDYGDELDDPSDRYYL